MLGVSCPETDGTSLWPVIKTGSKHSRKDALYWEFTYKGRFAQAVRFRVGQRQPMRWKAIRPDFRKGAIEIYDLINDPQESEDLAATQPKVLSEAIRLLDNSAIRVPNKTAPTPAD